jgi:hypothetical protein
LDQLFGERHAKVANVTQRTAIVVHKALDVPLFEAAKRVDRLYDLRSRFVHQGIEPRSDYLAEADLICKEVLMSLMRLRHHEGAREDPDFLRTWLTTLDFYWSACKAGRTIDQEDFADFGIGERP